LVRRDATGNLKQGPAFNSTLTTFIQKGWEPTTAAAKCPSLDKLLNALSTLEADWQKRLR
jgi:hypothetical protein